MLKLLNLTELMQVLKEDKHKQKLRNTLGNNNIIEIRDIFNYNLKNKL